MCSPLLCLLFQIDPKVAFPRRAQPKVGSVGRHYPSRVAVGGGEFCSLCGVAVHAAESFSWFAWSCSFQVCSAVLGSCVAARTSILPWL